MPNVRNKLRHIQMMKLYVAFRKTWSKEIVRNVNVTLGISG